MELLMLLSMEHPALAVAECQAVFAGKKWKGQGKLLTVELEGEELPSFSPLAYTKSIHKVWWRGSLEEFSFLKQSPVPVQGSVKVSFHKADRSQYTSTKIRSAILSKFVAPDIDLRKPDHHIEVFELRNEELLVTETMWLNTEKFDARQNKFRPAPHPTSLQPRLARAMIHLSKAKKTLLDPFCGSGGILIESTLMSLKTTGIDIDPDMIARAKENLAFAKVSCTLKTGDALTSSIRADAIVCDLPYGRNSKAGELTELYTQFLEHAKSLSHSLVCGFPSTVDSDALVKESGWQKEYKFSIPLHKSLDKHIYVLSHVS